MKEICIAEALLANLENSSELQKNYFEQFYLVVQESNSELNFMRLFRARKIPLFHSL